MTLDRETVWTRVQELLDARQDPLADDEVLRALESDPALATGILRLTDRLGRLPLATPPASIQRDPWRALVRFAAAVVVVAMILAVIAPLGGELGSDAPSPVSSSLTAPAAHVVTWRVEVVTEHAGGREGLSWDGDGAHRRWTQRTIAPAGDPLPAPRIDQPSIFGPWAVTLETSSATSPHGVQLP